VKASLTAAMVVRSLWAALGEVCVAGLLVGWVVVRRELVWPVSWEVVVVAVLLHSRADDVVPFADSVEIVANSRLPETALIEVGQDHRLTDPEPLASLLRAVEGR